MGDATGVRQAPEAAMVVLLGISTSKKSNAAPGFWLASTREGEGLAALPSTTSNAEGGTSPLYTLSMCSW